MRHQRQKKLCVAAAVACCAANAPNTVNGGISFRLYLPVSEVVGK